MIVRVTLLLLWFVLVGGTQVSAQEPLPKDQWTPEAKLWLARAMVSEAGWTAHRDHAALAWVLVRRWQIIQMRWPEIRFVAVVRRYCAGLRMEMRALTPRQRWVRELPWGPPQRNLSRYERKWDAVREYVERWGAGYVADPCGGDADHWGGRIDTPSKLWSEVDCGETHNSFYSIERARYASASP